MSEYHPHPLALEFPPLGEDEFNELADSIEQNGLLNEIILYDGQILDGIHRQKACVERGVEPRYKELPPDTDIESYVRALNLDRRHLARQDALTIALKIVKASHKKRSAAVPTSVPSSTIRKKSGVSDRQARRAKAVVEGAIEPILDFAKQKIISTETAAKIAKLDKKHQKTAAERIVILRAEGFKTVTFNDLTITAIPIPKPPRAQTTIDSLAAFYGTSNPNIITNNDPDPTKRVQYDPTKPPLPGGMDMWDPRSQSTPAHQPSAPSFTIDQLLDAIEPFILANYPKHPDQPRKCLSNFINSLTHNSE